MMTDGAAAHSGGDWPHPTWGFCMPCEGIFPTDTPQITAELPDNPFPLLTDLQTAWTIPPIKAFWLPLAGERARMVGESAPLTGDDFEDLCVFMSHESVHLFLWNTSLGFLTMLMIQLQYATVIRSLADEHPIQAPSLTEPSGLLAKTQVALRSIERPLMLVHELMATTLVRFFAERQMLFVTFAHAARLSQERDIRLVRPFLRIKGPETNDIFNALVLLECPPSLVRRIMEVSDHWGAAYAKHFHEEDFSDRYKRLLAAWRTLSERLGDTAEADMLLLLLAMYPLSGLAVSGTDLAAWTSTSGIADNLSACLEGVSNEPQVRLDTFLVAVEHAPASLREVAQWRAYFRDVLDDFSDRWFGYGLLVGPITHVIWEMAGFPDTGAMFEALYSREAVASSLTALPLIDRLGDAIDRQNHGMYRFHFAIEAMRQALLTGRGVPCLCDALVRDHCGIKGFLKHFWGSVIPDAGYETWFAEHWHIPECVEP